MTTAFDVWLDQLREDLQYNPESGDFTWKRPRMGGVRTCDPAGFIDNKRKTRRITFDGKKYSAKRLAWVMMTGRWPSGPVYCRNGDSTDLSWDNLEIKKPK